MEDRYNNFVLDEKFADIKASLDRIEVQTKKTNGSVADLKMWRAYLTGGMAVTVFLLTSLIAVVIPLLSAWFQK